MRSDILGRIAAARAAMSARGHAAPHLIIGPETLDDLVRETEVPEFPELFGMPVVKRQDMEGFAVVPEERKKATRGQLRAAAQWMLEQALKEKREGKTDLAGALTTASEYSVAVGCDGEFGED